MKYRPMAGMKYCLRQHEIPLRAMKYLPTEGMEEALQSNAIQIWLLLEEKLAAKPTDEADLPAEGMKYRPAVGMKYCLAAA